MMSQLITIYITSKDAFASMFASSVSDGLLLCFDAVHDSVTPDGLHFFEDKVKDCVDELSMRLTLYLWDCTSSAFADAKAQLDKSVGYPLLLVIYRGQIADTLRAVTLEQITNQFVGPMCERMACFQQKGVVAQRLPAECARYAYSDSARTAGVSTRPKAARAAPASQLPAFVPQTDSATSRTLNSAAEDEQQTHTLRVDVAKMMYIGQDLLAKSHAVYAEKVFLKAVNLLDVMYDDVVTHGTRQEEETVLGDVYARSLALALAYTGLSQLVQGKEVRQNTFFARLHQRGNSGKVSEPTTRTLQLQSYCDEPLSDVNRACTVQALMTALDGGVTWNAETASMKALTAVLRDTPLDDTARALLVITLFLRGDVERAMTESIKLREVRRSDFGAVAVRALCHFLGNEHELVRRTHTILENVKKINLRD